MERSRDEVGVKRRNVRESLQFVLEEVLKTGRTMEISVIYKRTEGGIEGSLDTGLQWNSGYRKY